MLLSKKVVVTMVVIIMFSEVLVASGAQRSISRFRDGTTDSSQPTLESSIDISVSPIESATDVPVSVTIPVVQPSDSNGVSSVSSAVDTVTQSAGDVSIPLVTSGVTVPVVLPVLDTSLSSATDIQLIASSGVSSATAEIAQQLGDVLTTLGSMTDSFVSDIGLYNSLYSELDSLVQLFDQSDTQRNSLLNSIMAWFSTSTGSASQLQSSYDALQQTTGQQQTQISTLQSQINSMTADATQEQQSLTEVISQLQTNYSTLQASCSTLSADQQQNVQQLATKLQNLNTQYSNMVTARNNFVQNMNDFQSMVAEHFAAEQGADQSIQDQLQQPLLSQ